MGLWATLMVSAACASKGTSLQLAAADEIGGLSATKLSHEKDTYVVVKNKNTATRL